MKWTIDLLDFSSKKKKKRKKREKRGEKKEVAKKSAGPTTIVFKTVTEGCGEGSKTDNAISSFDVFSRFSLEQWKLLPACF